MSNVGNIKKKLVLYLTPLPPPVGGISTWSAKLLKYGLPNEFSLAIVNTSTMRNRNTHEQARFNFLELNRNILVLYKLLTRLLFDRPDVVHINCCLSPTGIFREFFCAVIAFFFRVKIVTHYRGNVADFPAKKFRGLSYYCLRCLFHISSVNLTLNSHSFYLVSSQLPKNKRNFVFKIPNFIDDNFFNQEIKKGKLSAESQRLRIIYVGSISLLKGSSEFISTARSFQQLDFVMIGNVVSGFESHLFDIPSNLKIIDQISHPSVLLEIEQSDILLFLSHSEGFPNVVLEAMAMGLAVIATTVGSIPEMIDEGKGGFLCNVADLDQISAAMIRMASLSSPEISEMGFYNYCKAKEQYSYTSVADRLTKIYAKALGITCSCD